jgi:hypothetical protein
MDAGTVDSTAAPRDAAKGGRVLEGVGRVSYGQQDGHPEITPFPSCLRSCLKFLGEERLPSNMAYARILCRSGAAFRLVWNPSRWDGGNVDILSMEEDAVAPVRRAFEASGFEARLFANADWERLRSEGRVVSESASGFPSFLGEEAMRKAVVSSIDDGKPVIAFGLIGPPEACIVAGYEDSGGTLLGWNFFQGFEEAFPERDFDPAGRFRKRDWYSRATGVALFGWRIAGAAAGAEDDARAEAADLIDLALEVMSTRRIGAGERGRVSGQAAFSSWAEAMRSGDLPCPEGECPEIARMMAACDALDMCNEGRFYAALYLSRLAESLADGEAEAAAALKQAALAFRIESGSIWDAVKLLGGPNRGPDQLAALASGETRLGVAERIRAAAAEEEHAAALLLKARRLLG